MLQAKFQTFPTFFRKTPGSASHGARSAAQPGGRPAHGFTRRRRDMPGYRAGRARQGSARFCLRGRQHPLRRAQQRGAEREVIQRRADPFAQQQKEADDARIIREQKQKGHGRAEEKKESVLRRKGDGPFFMQHPPDPEKVVNGAQRGAQQDRQQKIQQLPRYGNAQQPSPYLKILPNMPPFPRGVSSW